MRRGVYPGSFNPPTVGHLAIADSARSERRLDRVVLCVSTVPLGKGVVDRPRFDDRIAVLREEAAATDWLDVLITDAQLLVDIAAGFDVVIMGADKWHQIHEVGFYGGSSAERDAAIAALPEVAVAPRTGYEVPPVLLLSTPESALSISSTGARSGRIEWMTPAARRFDRLTGAWSDPARYDRLPQGRPTL